MQFSSVLRVCVRINNISKVVRLDGQHTRVLYTAGTDIDIDS